MRKWIIGIVTIVLACGGAITLLVRNGNGAVEERPTTTVSRGDIADAVIAIGSVQPDISVTVKAKVSGIVEYVGAEAGDAVSKGQIIVELDKDILRGEVASAAAELSVARAALVAAEAEFESAGTEQTFQHSEYERARNLSERGLISPQELEGYRLRRDGADEVFRARDAQRAVAAARVEKAKVAEQLMKDRLSYATLRSPMDGVLLSRPVEIGSAVADVTAYDQTVFVVGDMHTLILDGEVDETEVGRVRLGQIARVQLEAFPDQTVTGTVTRIAPQGTDVNNIVRFNVEITLDATTLPLRAQLTGDAEIIVDEHHDVLLIPERAIQYDADGPFVHQPAEDPKADPAVVRLTIGYTNGTSAEVVSGLDEGAVVLLPAAA